MVGETKSSMSIGYSHASSQDMMGICDGDRVPKRWHPPPVDHHNDVLATRHPIYHRPGGTPCDVDDLLTGWESECRGQAYNARGEECRASYGHSWDPCHTPLCI